MTGTAAKCLAHVTNHYYINPDTNRISEAWTFSGILVRQAYALRLHRSLDAGSVDPSFQHQYFRQRIWQAVVVQDVSIAFHLHLPPIINQVHRHW